MAETLHNPNPIGWRRPRFSLDDCRELDRIAQLGAKSAPDMPRLDEAKLGSLHHELNYLGEMYRVVVEHGPMPTLRQRRKIQESIMKSAGELLSQFGIDEFDNPEEFHQHHRFEFGMFDRENVDASGVLSSIQEIAQYARVSVGRISREIDMRDRAGIVEKRQQGVPLLNELYVDLASIYADYWSPVGVSTSVNDGKGGPAVRFIQYTLERIVRKPFKPQSIKDAINKIKNGTIVVGVTWRLNKPRGI